MKAFYPQLSYTFFIAISIIALSIVMVTINTFANDIQRNYAYGHLNYIAENIRREILEIYSTNAEGKFELPVPKEVIGKQYSIELDQNNLKLELQFNGKIIQVERYVNISASLSGKSFAPASIEMSKTGENIFIRLV